jgi:glycosyltransferase involved in cell wall biosynthesis
VIIPVSDDPGIVDCVQSLISCHEPTVEVIVVLNGATESYTSAVKQQLVAHDWVRFVEIKERSIPGARNRGVQSARAPKILMFDSDCRPETTGYLTSVAESLGDADVVLGPVQFRSLGESRLSTAYAALRQLDYDLHQLNRLYSPNLAYRSTVVDAVGAYNERLVTGEDSEWGFRVLAAGYAVRRIDATVIHKQNASLRDALRTWFLYGRAKGAQAWGSRSTEHSLLSDLAYVFAPLGSYLSTAGGVFTTLWLRPMLACAFQAGFFAELLLKREENT